MKLLLTYMILTLVIPEISAEFRFIKYLCRYNGTSPITTHESNVNTVLTSLSSAPPNTYGYYNISAGEYPNKVSAMVLCRGDISPDACHLCVQNSVAEIRLKCTHQYQAFGFTNDCVICYTNKTLFHHLTVTPRKEAHIKIDVSNIKEIFNSTVYTLLNRLSLEASLGDSQLKYATGEMRLTSDKMLYGMVQCSPDLSRHQCISCVQKMMSSYISFRLITSNFTAAGARTSAPSCNFRYETHRFFGNQSYFPTPPAPSSSTPVLPESGKRKKSHSIAAVVILVTIVGAIIMTVIIFLLVKKTKKKKTHSSTKFNTVLLQVPSQPAFFTSDHTYENTSDQSNDISAFAYSINEVTKTPIYPR